MQTLQCWTTIIWVMFCKISKVPSLAFFIGKYADATKLNVANMGHVYTVSNCSFNGSIPFALMLNLGKEEKRKFKNIRCLENMRMLQCWTTLICAMFCSVSKCFFNEHSIREKYKLFKDTRTLQCWTTLICAMFVQYLTVPWICPIPLAPMLNLGKEKKRKINFKRFWKYADATVLSDANMGLVCIVSNCSFNRSIYPSRSTVKLRKGEEEKIQKY